MQSNEVRSGVFNLRSSLHENQSAQESGTSCYGVRKQCVFTKTKSFLRHVLSGYPPVVMHDIGEVVVPVETAYCLSLPIAERYFTWEGLNAAILHFPYQWTDRTSKPPVVPGTFPSRRTVGGNAHEDWSFIRLLPFLVGNRVPEGYWT